MTSDAVPFVPMLIGGEWVDSTTGMHIEVEAPAQRRTIALVPRAAPADIGNAVNAADEAFYSWRQLPPRERGRRLNAVADDLAESVDSLAVELALETGNAIRTQARPEITQAIDFFRYFGDVASEFKGEHIPHDPKLLNYVVREPLGVIGGIVPWNSPAMLGASKICMAIAAGNTIVLKAPEDAPLTLIRIAEACHRHLPSGVVNMVTGYGEEAGRALVANETVAKISFTGSTEVGMEIGRVSGGRLAPVVLELGGKSPAIVYPDSDNDDVARGVIDGMRFTRQGQGCSAGSRLLVHTSIFDSFLDRVVKQVAELRIGDPTDETTDIGALINAAQYGRVCGYIEDAIASGGTVLTGGMPDDTLGPGYFVQPTILTEIDRDHRVAREEVFGPVLVAFEWTDEDEMISMANDTPYGLAAYIWCRDIGRALAAVKRLDVGTVQVNRGGGPLIGMPTGGIGRSGFGREHSLEAAIDEFTYRKNVVVAIDS
jgi:betaine-aldehyde dehydrogenase